MVGSIHAHRARSKGERAPQRASGVKSPPAELAGPSRTAEISSHVIRPQAAGRAQTRITEGEFRPCLLALSIFSQALDGSSRSGRGGRDSAILRGVTVQRPRGAIPSTASSDSGQNQQDRAFQVSRARQQQAPRPRRRIPQALDAATIAGRPANMNRPHPPIDHGGVLFATLARR